MTRPPLRDYGAALTVRIVRHPETRRIITMAQDRADLGPLDEAMSDQVRAYALGARLAGVRVIDPDGIATPNPLGPSGWWPDPAERWVAALAAEGFRWVVRQVADDLVAAGVPVDPKASMDLIVIAELLLLDIDWSQSSREIAERLQPPAPWAVSEDGRTLIVRADLRGQAERDAIVWRRQVEATAREGAGRATLPSASYAGGKTRQTSEQVRRRRAALAAVLKRWPDIGAEELRVIGGRPTPSTMVFLAELAASGRPWRPEDLRSHRRALRDDLAFLRRETTEQDHNG